MVLAVKKNNDNIFGEGIYILKVEKKIYGLNLRDCRKYGQSNWSMVGENKQNSTCFCVVEPLRSGYLLPPLPRLDLRLRG